LCLKRKKKRKKEKRNREVGWAKKMGLTGLGRARKNNP
jgi:hypothetical protein